MKTTLDDTRLAGIEATEAERQAMVNGANQKITLSINPQVRC